MVIFHSYVSHNQMVNLGATVPAGFEILLGSPDIDILHRWRGHSQRAIVLWAFL